MRATRAFAGTVRILKGLLCFRLVTHRKLWQLIAIQIEFEFFVHAVCIPLVSVTSKTFRCAQEPRRKTFVSDSGLSVNVYPPKMLVGENRKSPGDGTLAELKNYSLSGSGQAEPPPSAPWGVTAA